MCGNEVYKENILTELFHSESQYTWMMNKWSSLALKYTQQDWQYGTSRKEQRPAVAYAWCELNKQKV